MKRELPVLIAISIIGVTLPAPGETPVTPRIEAVDLFKNGLAVFRASFEAAQSGIYRWEKVPRVVHGTFWVESDGRIDVQATTRRIEQREETELPTGVLQSDLAGKSVTVALKTVPPAGAPVVNGTVWNIPDRLAKREWNFDYAPADPFANSFARQRQESERLTRPTTGDFLVLEAEGGSRSYVELANILSLRVDGPFAPKTRLIEMPVLLFDIKDPPSGGKVFVSFLGKGISWVPSYHADLTAPDTIRLRQSAVVRNEAVKIADAELRLISGYPNIRFSHVDSPLWPGSSLAGFFQQLNQRDGSAGGPMTQQALVMSNTMRLAEAAPLPDPGEGASGEDIHYQSIGRRTLEAGDSLALEVARAHTRCERVVEWVVPDPRDEKGRYFRASGREPGLFDEDGQPWDAVKFSNPFTFPMTTASAMLVEGGRFRGQSLSQWVNPGQRTSLRITRALSVRTEHSEVEEEGQREIVWIGGDNYQRTKARGILELQNFRSSPVTLSIRAEFSGELIEAAGQPDASLRREGMTSVNPRRQLEWTVRLAPGEEKSLAYRYSVLVHR